MKKSAYYIYFIIVLILTGNGCTKFVNIESPIDQTITKDVYSNSETATAAIRGIYAKMNSGGFADGGINSVTILAGRSADEFTNYSTNERTKQFATNSLSADNTILRSGLWQSPYQIIYAANSVLENLARSNLPLQVKQQLSGEAKFIRAFCYFYLVNLFGEIPLVLTTDYKINETAFATSKPIIYDQIIKDLLEAKIALPDKYPSGERIRANKWVAAALLSRVYLYRNEWSNAEVEASDVIAQTNYYQLTLDLDAAFLKNSKESIFQLGSTVKNTSEAAKFILTSAPGSTTEVTLSDGLVSDFEVGDQRRLKWVGTFTNGSNSWHYPMKYRAVGSAAITEYTTLLRIAEQYLIRAEARINMDKIGLGIDDLNVLRIHRRSAPTPLMPNPLPNLSTTLDKSMALRAVEHERRIELFSEWGHRWLDLKRTDRTEQILSIIKGTNWQNTDVLYPIPASDLLNNPNLKQNQGYQ